MAVLQSLISLWKRKGEKEKKFLQHGVFEFGHPWTTKAFEQGLTLLSELNMLLSLWYSDYAIQAFFFNCLDEKWYQKEKNTWYCMAEKVENKKIRGIWKWELLLALVIGQAALPYNCLGLSHEDNSFTRTDNFVNVNVFNSVTSPRVLSYLCVSHYFLTGL